MRSTVRGEKSKLADLTPSRQLGVDVAMDGGGPCDIISCFGVDVAGRLLFLRDGTARKERGFHANDLGCLDTAESIAGVVEDRVGLERPAPTDSVAPPTSETIPPTVNPASGTSTSARISMTPHHRMAVRPIARYRLDLVPDDVPGRPQAVPVRRHPLR